MIPLCLILTISQEDLKVIKIISVTLVVKVTLTIREHLQGMKHKLDPEFSAAIARWRYSIEMTAALKTVNQRLRQLRQLRRDHGTCTLEQAVELAESIGYDTTRNWGQKGVAYLMRTTTGAVRRMLEPEVVAADDEPDDDGLDEFLNGL